MIAVPKVERPAERPRLSKVGNLNVLRVDGSFYDMGYQHGEALAAQIPDGPVLYFRRYLERVFGGPQPRAWMPAAWGVARQVLGRQVMKRIPPYARETIEGLADGANVPLQSLMDGYTMPDSFLWVASRMMQARQPGPAVAHRLQLGLGCTSAIAWGDATQDGRLLHARNFDFYGVSQWPSAATVIFADPDEGQRYVSVASAGVPLGGVTAMNEAGLTLTVHQHLFTDRARLGGTPTGLIGDRVMREAESLDDAEKILNEHDPIGCWTYVVTDGKTREVLCFEENPDHKAARRAGPNDDTFGYANVYVDDVLGETEVNLYPSYWRHNSNRHRRANELLENRSEPHTPASMAAILADHGGDECRISGGIGMLMTVGSVVFRPEDGTVWVASGEAPVSFSEFVPFSLADEDRASNEDSIPAIDLDDVEREAFLLYRDAYLAYFDEADFSKARAKMREAVKLRPHDAMFAMLEGFLSLLLEDGPAALTAFDRAVREGHHHRERLATFHLWRGRAHDLCGHRHSAKRDYRTALAHTGDANVHRAARKNLKRAFGNRSARSITVDFVYADVVQP